jgi:hypothetical protein
MRCAVLSVARPGTGTGKSEREFPRMTRNSANARETLNPKSVSALWRGVGSAKLGAEPKISMRWAVGSWQFQPETFNLKPETKPIPTRNPPKPHAAHRRILTTHRRIR